jgi:hypothetical protein
MHTPFFRLDIMFVFSARSTAIACAVLATAACTLSRAASAQRSWRSYVDASRVRAESDSFTVHVNGQLFGWQKIGAITRGAEWTLFDEATLGTVVQQRSDVRFSSTFVEQSLRQTGTMQGKRMAIVLARENGAFVGTAITPASGDSTIRMRVSVSDDVIDDNAITPLLPYIRWTDGLTVTIPVLKSGKGTVAPNTLTVRGTSTWGTAGNAVEVWQIAISEADRVWLEALVTTAAPFRVVRMGPPGGRMISELAR